MGVEVVGAYVPAQIVGCELVELAGEVTSNPRVSVADDPSAHSVDVCSSAGVLACGTSINVVSVPVMEPCCATHGAQVVAGFFWRVDDVLPAGVDGFDLDAQVGPCGECGGVVG